MSKIVENLTVGQEVICLYCDDRDGELIRGKNLKVSYVPHRVGGALYRVHDANHSDKEYKMRRKFIMEYERFSKYGFSENMVNKLANGGYCDGEVCSGCTQHQLCNLSDAIDKIKNSSDESSFKTYDDIVITGILSRVNALKNKDIE